ncbi:hypothetical protein [Encephalitozoon cuniculi GB-M1]|uniref:Uncharacterized protein n=2 Tax=Encephalitozoon cuniculi TaxID=6035 RepID=Q8SUX9_ENCCU|nr:uncharacterized protein ECU07_1200 [Encephalitozoon cuniculi GB-M1]AGE95896.1 hypothetical protein ECU07_1200 [Encephalitozoon cuniculi]KMV65845.1 hypothetical protein M970_071170 [Encephalitozoon cuniculi EcunIII-L]UYI27284.1 hypothetical protein J0A71_05g11430 [Encephalitozoon cuniculi]CAD25653.1 hypothetical protein [Encephalitozoon cuniculi GB-M1]
MEGEGTIERVKEMLQKYSSRGGSFSEGSFLSDIDMSDASFTSWEEELASRIVRSLRNCKEMTEIARRKRVCVLDRELMECMAALRCIRKNIEGLRKEKKYRVGWTVLVGSVLVGIACISAKHYF